MRLPVSETCILIDDSGRILRWPDDGRQVGRVAHDPDFDFLDYATRNLGFVAVFERAGFMRVRLRPAFCGRRTAAALLDFLAQRQQARAGITYFSRIWHHEICAGASLAPRLAELLTVAEDDEAPFQAVPRRISTLLHATGSPFTPILRRWLDNAQPEGLASFLATCGLYDRSMIVERMGDSGHFVFRHSGRGIQLYPSGWTRSAVGRFLHDQPDRAYGAWIAEACRAVDDRQVPRRELILARVAHEHGRAPHHWRYERLMLPWRSGDGRRLIVSVSLRDQAGGRA
jgi:hypothetical protein